MLRPQSGARCKPRRPWLAAVLPPPPSPPSPNMAAPCRAELALVCRQWRDAVLAIPQSLFIDCADPAASLAANDEAAAAQLLAAERRALLQGASRRRLAVLTAVEIDLPAHDSLMEQLAAAASPTLVWTELAWMYHGLGQLPSRPFPQVSTTVGPERQSAPVGWGADLLPATPPSALVPLVDASRRDTVPCPAVGVWPAGAAAPFAEPGLRGSGAADSPDAPGLPGEEPHWSVL